MVQGLLGPMVQELLGPMVQELLGPMVQGLLGPKVQGSLGPISYFSPTSLGLANDCGRPKQILDEYYTAETIIEDEHNLLLVLRSFLVISIVVAMVKTLQNLAYWKTLGPLVSMVPTY